MTLTSLSLPHCWYVVIFIAIIHQHNVNQMTWCWQSEISLLLNANKGGKLHNKLSFQRSCHYQTTEHCLATDNNRSTSSWKETSGASGRAPQIKFDLCKFYAVFKL